MKSVVKYFQSFNGDIGMLAKGIGVPIVLFLVISVFCRFIWGKRSLFAMALSSAIGIVLLYTLSLLLCNLGFSTDISATPLPFITIVKDRVLLFSFQTNFTATCGHLVSMVILAFLMNLIDGLLPRGKNILLWIIFRCASVLGALISYLIVSSFFVAIFPEAIVTYAPMILLGILILMLLTGALKFIVGLALTTINPVIAALYTFFFANIIGKQITKAILTTAILSGLVFMLHKLGIVSILLSTAALVAYIPVLLILIALWYIIGKLL